MLELYDFLIVETFHTDREPFRLLGPSSLIIFLNFVSSQCKEYNKSKPFIFQ